MQAARKTPRMQKKAEMARGCLEEVMVQGRREEVIPQERQKMARERLEEVMVQGRREMDRGRLAGCRRELPEQMIARRCRTGCRRKKMATCRAMQHRTEQEVTVEEHRAEMAA